MRRGEKSVLTNRQQEVYQYIINKIHAGESPPTVREIAEAFHMSSPRSAVIHLLALERKGMIQRVPGKARGIRVIGRQERPQESLNREIPVLGRVAAGRPILAEENLEGSLYVDRRLAPWPEVFLLRVKGDSMVGAGILEGDLVLVHPQMDADSGEIVVVLLEDEATVKRLRKEKRQIILEAANPLFPPLEVRPPLRLQIIGVVRAVIRHMGRLS